MNNIKLILSLIIVISVYSAYEDCVHVEKDYTIKNAGPLDTNGKATDYKVAKNFTFIAGSKDDCKSRTVRKYRGDDGYYDSADSSVNTKETNLEHCCYLTYDNMEKYEDPNKLVYELDSNSRNGRKVTSEEKITGKCIALTEFQYKNIKDYIELTQLQNDDLINLKIDCSSHNLKFFFLSLFLLILF